MSWRRLMLRAGEAVDGLALGRHALRRRGRAQTFREHRPYQAGDDLRHVDWHALARHDALFVKVFEDEAPIRVELLLDASASMGTLDKLTTARALTQALGQLALAAGEEVGLHLLTADPAAPLHRSVELARGASQLPRLAQAIEAAQDLPATPLPEALLALARTLKRRSHIIVLSDLWVQPQQLAMGLGQLCARRHDLTLVQVGHVGERTLSHVGPATWVGLEGEREVQGDARSMAFQFAAAVQAHDALLAQVCRAARAVLVPVDVAEPLEVQLRRIVLAPRPSRRRSAG